MSIAKLNTTPATGGDSSNTLLILLGLAIAGAIAYYVMREKDEEPAPVEEETK